MKRSSTETTAVCWREALKSLIEVSRHDESFKRNYIRQRFSGVRRYWCRRLRLSLGLCSRDREPTEQKLANIFQNLGRIWAEFGRNSKIVEKLGLFRIKGTCVLFLATWIFDANPNTCLDKDLDWRQVLLPILWEAQWAVG